MAIEFVLFLFYGKVMNDARAVANFFLDRADKLGIPLTPMTLLKVLYFAHAWYLAKFDEKLVAQPFEAWKYGPVNRVIYEQIRRYRNGPVVGKLRSLDINTCKYVSTSYSFDADTEKLLCNVFDYYARYSAFQLSDMTHEKGSPWDIIWQKAENAAVPGMIIPDNLIRDWVINEFGRGEAKPN